MSKKIKSEQFSFEGWNIKSFLKGRKKLLLNLVAGVCSYVITQNPTLTAVMTAFADMGYALIEYYYKQY